MSEAVKMPGTLYVISTPLGNVADFSPRAVATLKEVALVFAEDTRSAAGLFASCGVERPLRSCFDANEAARADEVAALLGSGESLALLSEAGTPAISDPGYRIVRAAIDAGARVVPVPGPSALLAALVGSGLPTDRFFFAGFPPRKSGRRRELFASLRTLPATLIFYESPMRAHETLVDLAATLGPDRPACLARELTKTHEEFVRDTLAALAARYERDRPLGEVTLVVGGAPEGGPALDEEALRARAAALLAGGASPRHAAETLAAEAHLPRRDAYKLVLSVRPGREG